MYGVEICKKCKAALIPKVSFSKVFTQWRVFADGQCLQRNLGLQAWLCPPGCLSGTKLETSSRWKLSFKDEQASGRCPGWLRLGRSRQVSPSVHSNCSELGIPHDYKGGLKATRSVGCGERKGEEDESWLSMCLGPISPPWFLLAMLQPLYI